MGTIKTTKLFLTGLFTLLLFGFSPNKETETVKIGNQNWMVKNLNVSHFNNGDLIPEAKTDEEWQKADAAGKPAWCYPRNDLKKGEKFGKLYNWWATNDPRGLAPAGMHVAKAAEWKELITYLGGQKLGGNKIKSTTGWKDSGNGSDAVGFNALPAGNRNADGSFNLFGEYGFWWFAANIAGPGVSANLCAVNNYSSKIAITGAFKRTGLSIRCLKD
jgi:uncharacterized protein (TIGR02145 family)